MRTIFFLLFSIASFGQDYASITSLEFISGTAVQAPSCACDFTIPASAYYVDVDKKTNANAYVINPMPGQTVCFAAGRRADLQIHNIFGAEGYPIYFRSCGGTVFSGTNNLQMLYFANSSFIQVIGDDGTGYGSLEFTGGGHGVNFAERSTNVRCAYVWFHDMGYCAFEAKTDPTCDPMTWRGNFTLRDVSFDHNTIGPRPGDPRTMVGTIDGEGLYIGESHYNTVGSIQHGPCASGLTQAKEHEVIGVRVENNTISNTGADGIQVGACTSGCSIQYNYVTNTGTKNAWGQNAGIIVNPGTVAEVAWNTVDTGTGFLIQMQGPGGSRVHHNLILNSTAGGVFAAVYPVAGMLPQPDYQIFNNTLINIRGVGLQYYNPVTFTNNVLQLATGAVLYKNDGGLAGKLTESGNKQLIGISGQLDAAYVPLATSTVPAGVGYKDYVKPPPVIIREPAIGEFISTDGIEEWFLTTPSGKRIKIK